MQCQFRIVHSITLVFLYRGSVFSRKSNISKVSFIGCVSKHVLFLKLFCLSSRPPRTMGNFLEISIAWRKCLCVSGTVDSFGPKVRNFALIYIYIYLISYIYRLCIFCFYYIIVIPISIYMGI